jgi:hypothetical protein
MRFAVPSVLSMATKKASQKKAKPAKSAKVAKPVKEVKPSAKATAKPVEPPAPKPPKAAPPPPKPKAPAAPDPLRMMADVFKRLKTMLRGYAAKLRVAKNDNDAYELSTKKSGPNGATLYFGGVHLGKKYVSYHLFPVYVIPKLLDGVSPKLKKRMQGKSCFNFEAVDEPLFEELAQLTQKGYETFEQRGMI